MREIVRGVLDGVEGTSTVDAMNESFDDMSGLSAKIDARDDVNENGEISLRNFGRLRDLVRLRI